MIAGVLLPDEGTVDGPGGVAPLIELTGGFIGELSARENIYLTAGLHGLTKRRRSTSASTRSSTSPGRRCRPGLDMPFRHFSSGMQVRLGFAVITTLDEPIVLVDEVLAVGDKAFREKCYQRMEALLAERPDAVPRLALRGRPAPLLHARALPQARRAAHGRADGEVLDHYFRDAATSD